MRLLYAFLTVACLGLPAKAQEEPIRQTIESQIDAFQRDDFLTAFSYASPNIRALFGTPENFGVMVRNGYPMVYRPDAVRMGELREVAGGLWQRVFVTDAQGRGHVLDYQMVETPEGWKINAVHVLQAADIGA